MRITAVLVALAFGGCDSDRAETAEISPTPAEELAALGERASAKFPEIRIRGSLGTSNRFLADYSPGAQSLIYELESAGRTERFTVGPEEAVYSVDGKPDQRVNRDSLMPNGLDWPYASRMAAPFLDAIDGYAATLHSFQITSATAPADVAGAASLKWFQLEPNKDTIHDLLLMEFSKVSQMKIGVDPDSGLLGIVYSVPKKAGQPPTEIRSE